VSDRRDLHKIAADLVDFINMNPTDRGKDRWPGHDVPNEPRVPKGNSDGGQWTTGGSSGGGVTSGSGDGRVTSSGGSRTSDDGASANDIGPRCPNGYEIVPMLVTGYTNGPESAGKRPGDSGYGTTASGAKAGPGTVAASTGHGFGTRMYIPGYGWGTVQDRGGKVKGSHIDLWFENVGDAKKWGKRTINVVVCKK
jgi:3D (Asp-Asp-Asp) domain-containing protein